MKNKINTSQIQQIHITREKNRKYAIMKAHRLMQQYIVIAFARD